MSAKPEKITIVHLSDLHFPGKTDDDVKIVIKALVEDISAKRSQDNQYDLVIFSGDLVQAGGMADQFHDAQAGFIEKIVGATGVPQSHLLLCPGNHDIDREAVRKEPWAESGLKQHLVTKAAINEFIDQYEAVDIFGNLPSPLKRMNNFYKHIWNDSSPNRLTQSPFASVYSFDLRGRSVGVACFNTAWRSTGEPDDRDRGYLVLGERVVDHALEALQNSHIRIATFHHPIYWLHTADQAAVDARLQAEFDFLLCGHIHLASPEIRKSTSGEAILSQGSSLYLSRDYFNGYNIINIHCDGQQSEIDIQEYSDQRRRFNPAPRIAENGSIKYAFCVRGSRTIARLTAMLHKIKPVVKQLANEHMSILGISSTILDIETHFVCPPLTALSQAATQVDDAIANREPEIDLLKDAIKGSKSIVIIGRPESGKTSLAHYMATTVGNGTADCPRLPLICQFSELRVGDRNFWRLVRSYAVEISDGSISREFVETEAIFVIVDNVDLYDETRIAVLQQLIKTRTNARWVLIVGSPATMVNINALATNYFSDLEIFSVRKLTRNAVRKLSANWIKSKDDDEVTDLVFRSVMEQIRRIGLPRSGYIVSLILWSIRNKSQGELLNEAALIQNIIDYLGRMDYTGALRSEFDFTSKTALLQYLAMFFKEKGEVQKKNDVVQFVVDLLKRKALDYDAAEIVGGFIDCGLMVQMADEISFRYKRFQEFFVAGYIRDNHTVMEEITKGDNWISYARDLDIYTARFRHEQPLLDFSKEKLKSIDIPAPDLTVAEAKEYLSDGLDPSFTQLQLRRMKRQKMTAAKIDRLMDMADREYVEKRQNKSKKETKGEAVGKETKILRFYLALEMYSQCIRNLEFVDRDIKRHHLHECLAGWEKALRGNLYALKEAFRTLEKQIPDSGLVDQELTEEKVMKFVKSLEALFKGVVPSFIAVFVYQNLGSE